MGILKYEDCSWSNTSGGVAYGPAAGDLSNPDAFGYYGKADELHINGFQAVTTGYVYTTPDAADHVVNPMTVLQRSGVVGKVFLRNISITSSGTRNGAKALSLLGMSFGGAMQLYVDGIRQSVTQVNGQNATMSVMGLGTLDGATISGQIRRIHRLSFTGDTTPTAIKCGGVSLAVGRLDVTGCDFSGMPAGGTEIAFLTGSGTSNNAIYRSLNRWIVDPPAAVVITLSGSPFAYQNTLGYPITVVVSGGTVTKIEVGRGGSTYYDTGETAGVFVLQHTDYLQVTYSGAPTMTALSLG
jgi:hypothetical protein